MNLYLNELEMDKEINKCMEELTELLRERTRDAIKINFREENVSCRIFGYTVSFEDGEYPAEIELRGGTDFTNEYMCVEAQYVKKKN